MPWKETCAMDEKVQLIGDWLRGDYYITELAESYGVSRKTVYKWIARYKVEGNIGLEERSRAPGSHPNAPHRWMLWRTSWGRSCATRAGVPRK